MAQYVSTDEARLVLDVLFEVGGLLHLQPRNETRSMRFAKAKADNPDLQASVSYAIPPGGSGRRPRSTVMWLNVLKSSASLSHQRVIMFGRPFTAYEVTIRPGCTQSMMTEAISGGATKLPLGYLQDISIDLTKPGWRDDLYQQVKRLLLGLSAAESNWKSSDSIIRFYRELFNQGCFGVVRQQLQSRVRLAEVLVGQGLMDVQALGIRVCALTKVLQQWGHWVAARRELSRFFDRVPRHELGKQLDSVTADTIHMVDWRVNHAQCPYQSDQWMRHCHAARQLLKQTYNVAKFVWRADIYDSAIGGIGEVDNLDTYCGLMKDEPVSRANVEFALAFRAIARQSDPSLTLYHARRYRDSIQLVWEHHVELPYTATQGVVSGLLVEATVLASLETGDRRMAALALIDDIELFKSNVEIYDTADGTQELALMRRLLPNDPLSCSRFGLSTARRARTQVDLYDLCQALDSLRP